MKETSGTCELTWGGQANNIQRMLPVCNVFGQKSPRPSDFFPSVVDAHQNHIYWAPPNWAPQTSWVGAQWRDLPTPVPTCTPGLVQFSIEHNTKPYVSELAASWQLSSAKPGCDQAGRVCKTHHISTPNSLAVAFWVCTGTCNWMCNMMQPNQNWSWSS